MDIRLIKKKKKKQDSGHFWREEREKTGWSTQGDTGIGNVLILGLSGGVLWIRYVIKNTHINKTKGNYVRIKDESVLWTKDYDQSNFVYLKSKKEKI